jgi:hypothetical protein
VKDEILEEIKRKLLVKLDDEFITAHRKIYCYRSQDGSCQPMEFLNSTTTQARASFAHLFKCHCQGHILRGERWHKLEDDLWEYKDNSSQTRIIHAMEEGNVVILLYGFGGKKENKIKPGHIKQALDLKYEYLSRRNEITEVKPTGERKS